VARIAPSAPVKPPSTAQPQPAALKPTPPKPTPVPPKATPPKPTFTAAKPTERAAPTFSAASPARPAPARPATPPSSQRASYGASNAGQGYPPPRWQGNNPPFPPSGAQYAPPAGQYASPNGQYAGPSQPSPDLGRQYTPGSTGGGRTGPRRQILWLLVAVIIAAAIGVGLALTLSSSGGGNNASTTSVNAVPSVADTPTGFQSINALNDPSAALPATDWSTSVVTAAQASSAAAGFSIDVPHSWTETRKGLATDFTGPGQQLLEIDLTQQSTSDMLTAATQVETASHFRAYQQQHLQAEPVRHAEGAFWQFKWTPAAEQYTADDIFFAQSTPAGVQDYAVYIRSPSSTFSASLATFDQMLQTLQTVPAS
jgi:hypothetical protein